MKKYKHIHPTQEMILNLGSISGSEAMLKARKLPRGEEVMKQLEDQRNKYFENKVIEL